MEVIVNNNPTTTVNNQSIRLLLNELNIASLRGTAVAVNNAVIPKLNWDDHLLKENDKITIIKATQGG